MTMTPQQIIDALQQTSNPIGKQLVREVVASMYRLLDMDVIVAEIREAAGLPDCPATDIPGHIAAIIDNLASQNVWLMSRLPGQNASPLPAAQYSPLAGGESGGDVSDQLPSCQGGVAEGRGGLQS